MKVIAMNDKVIQAIAANDQVMTDVLELQKLLASILGDIQEANRLMVEALGEER